MMTPDDAASRIQSQARSLANSFGGEKRFKYMSQNIRWNPRTVVANLDEHAVEFACGPHPQFTLPVHGLDRIGHQVCPNLIEFPAEGADSRQGLVVFANHLDSAFELVVQIVSVFSRP